MGSITAIESVPLSFYKIHNVVMCGIYVYHCRLKMNDLSFVFSD